MSSLRRSVLLIALSAALSGCFLFRPSLDYKLLRTEVSVDPVSGDVTRTFYWEYEDGDQTTTVDVIRKGEDNEQRRGERPTPRVRFLKP